MKRSLSCLQAMLVYILYGISYLAIIKASEVTGGDSYRLCAFRFSTAFLILTGLVKAGILHVSFYSKPLKSLIVLSVIRILYFSCETLGLRGCPSSVASLFLATVPVFSTLLAALFLKQLPRKREVLLLITSILGVVLVKYSPDSNITFNFSVLLIWFAVLFSSIYNLNIFHAYRFYNAAEITYFTTGALAAFFVTVSFFQHLAGGTLPHYFDGVFTGTFILSILYLAAGATVLGLLLLNKVLHELPVMVVSAFNALTTVVAVICGALFLGESFTVFIFGGMCLILLSVFMLAALSGRK